MVQFRTTLYNDALYPAGVQVKTPDGLADAEIILRRDKKFGSLIEFFEGDFLWYGDAMRVFQEVETDQGPDAKLTLKLELSEQINKWELISWHRFQLSMLEEHSKGFNRYEMKIPIINDDFWSKFYNRFGVPVDLLSELDLDGNVCEVVPQFTLPLASQKIRSSFRGLVNNTFVDLANISGYFQFNSTDQSDPDDVHGVDPIWNVATGNHIQIGFDDDIVLDEVKNRETIPISIVEEDTYTSLPGGTHNEGVPMFFLDVKYAGSYRFQPRIELSIYAHLWTNNGVGGPGSREYEITDHFASSSSHIDLYLQVNNGVPILFNKEESPLVLEKVSTIYTLDETIELLVGDKVRIYAQVINSVDWYDVLPTPPFSQPAFGNELIHLMVWGNTNVIYPVRITFAFITGGEIEAFYAGNAPLIPAEYDAGEAPSGEPDPTRLVITADTVFQDTEAEAFLIFDALKNIIRKYTGVEDCLDFDEASITRLYAILKGLHVRGYTLADKPFSMSADDWWQGLDPILNLGLDISDGKIRIRPKSFYRNIDNVVSLSNVPDIIRTYAQDRLYRSIKQGYSKWSAESESGIDDPQTVHTRAGDYATIGIDFTNLSNIVAASLAIEQTRRNQVELAKDWRMDEDIMIVALKEDGENYLPEVGADFDNVQNLLNPDERINLRITAARNFKRWQNVYDGCYAGFAGKQWKFVKGEGNYDTITTLPETDTEEIEVNEKQNFNTSSNFLTTPKQYKFEYPLTWTTYKEIRASKERAIGLSRTDTDHSPHFIEELRFQLAKGKAIFDVSQGGAGEGFILLETGDKILTETGDFIKVE